MLLAYLNLIYFFIYSSSGHQCRGLPLRSKTFIPPTNSEHKFHKARIENLLSIVFELGFLWLGTQWMGLPLLITRILTNNGVGESKKIIYLAISTILVDCSWLVVVKITLIVSRKVWGWAIACARLLTLTLLLVEMLISVTTYLCYSSGFPMWKLLLSNYLSYMTNI